MVGWVQRLRASYPRDAMLARVLAKAPCLAVCLAVTSRSSIERTERMELVVGMEAFFLPVLHCVERKFGYLQKQGYFLLELCPKFRTWKISRWHIDRRNVLST